MTAIVPSRKGTLRRVAPAIGLFLVSPLVAEFLLGNIAIDAFFGMILLAPLYGGGALLIREVTRHTGRGWPTMIVLGMAYAAFEEGLATQSLFNPNYFNAGLLQITYIPTLGIGVWWTAYVLTLHTVWSTNVPIAIVESFVPERSTQPWLGNIGLAVAAVLLALGAIFTFLGTYTQSGYVAPAPRLIGAAIAIVVLIAIAFALPTAPRPPLASPAPSPWLVGAVSFVLTSIFVQRFDALNGWVIVGIYLVLDIVTIALILRWSRQAGWSQAHILALAGGALLTYAWHAFVQTPVVGSTGQIDLIGNVIFAVGAVALLVGASRGRGGWGKGGSSKSREIEKSRRFRHSSPDSPTPYFLLSPYPPTPLSPYNAAVIRIAAVADIHAGPDSVGVLGPLFAGLRDEADLLLLPGDLTRDGDPADAEILVSELQDVGVPIVAILGNHDFEADQAPAIVNMLRAAGMHILDRSGIVVDVAEQRVAIAGTKGFGGGFGAALADDVGEPEMKAWIHHAEVEAETLEDVLNGLVGDVRIVMLHYAPVTDTLAGERLELYPFSGNSMLGAAIDRAGADLVLHGHVHRGSPAGLTPGGIPVRNVAQPVIRKPYVVFTIDEEEDESPPRPRWRRHQESAEGAAGEEGGPRREGRQPRWMRRAARLARRDDAPAE